MKIFSLSLSLEFALLQPQQRYDFDPISWQSLTQQMSLGQAQERQFYVHCQAEPTAEAVFGLQSSESWRESGCALMLLFPDSSALSQFLEDFMGFFQHRVAAGGMVLNDQEQYCCILHHGYWTLPKGHVDPGETIEAAAVREVEEETGLTNLSLGERLPQTFHTYQHKGQWVLKTTHWFRMHTEHQPLTPQTDEDITEAAWLSKMRWLQVARYSYAQIRELFEAEFARNL